MFFNPFLQIAPKPPCSPFSSRRVGFEKGGCCLLIFPFWGSVLNKWVRGGQGSPQRVFLREWAEKPPPGRFFCPFRFWGGLGPSQIFYAFFRLGKKFFYLSFCTPGPGFNKNRVGNLGKIWGAGAPPPSTRRFRAPPFPGPNMACRCPSPPPACPGGSPFPRRPPPFPFCFKTNAPRRGPPPFSPPLLPP